MVEGARLFGVHDMTFVEEVVVTELGKATKEMSLILQVFESRIEQYVPCCGRSCLRCLSLRTGQQQFSGR